MKFSIITASYNSLGTLPAAMESLFKQTHQEFEWIVVDGNSSDGTPAWLASQNDVRIRFISEPDSGIYEALNKGLAMSTGDVVGFLHADDLLANEDVLSQVSATFQRDNCDGVYGDLQYVRADDTQLILRDWRGRKFTMWQLEHGWMPAHPTLFIKRCLYVEHGGFDLSFRIAADYDFMLRLMKKSQYKWTYQPILVTLMRWGGASNQWGNWLSKKCEDWRAIRKNNLRFPVLVLMYKNLSKIKQLRYISR